MISPLVSVVVPVHLREPPYLLEAVSSLASQDYEAWEAVVVDDGGVLAPAVKRQVEALGPRVVAKEKGGVSLARNFGAMLARGQLLAFLDFDDYWQPNHLSGAVKALYGDARAVGVYSSLEVVRGASKEHVSFIEAHPVDRQSVFSGGARPIINSLVVRREVMGVLGGFDPGLCAAEDVDFIYELVRIGPVLANVEVTVAYRLHEGNQTAAKLREKARFGMLVLERQLARASASGDNQEVEWLSQGARRARSYWSWELTGGAVRSVRQGRLVEALLTLIWAARWSPGTVVRRVAGQAGRWRIGGRKYN